MMKQSITVSADHSCPDYRLDKAVVAVGHDSDGTYSAFLSRFGYVCDFATPEAAILDLLKANGCTNIRIGEDA